MESISENVALEVVAIKKSAHLYSKRMVEAFIEDAISKRIMEDKQNDTNKARRCDRGNKKRNTRL